MILLRGQRILFIKPLKTASTSVDIAFSCNATEDDIVTPLRPADEMIRKGVGGTFPVNWAKKQSTEDDFRTFMEQYAKDSIQHTDRKGKPKRPYSKWRATYYNHLTPDKFARRIRGICMEDVFMVTMVRHPYDVVVSYASHVRAQSVNPDEPLGRFLDKTIAKRPINDKFLFTKHKPSFVIRYEHLEEDLSMLEGLKNLKLVENLPFTKHKFRRDRRDPASLLSDLQKAKIRKKYWRTFETYGYSAD